MNTATNVNADTRLSRVIARLRRRRAHFRCLACGQYFSRDKPYCPYCKTHKGGRGQNVPPLGGA